MDWNSLAMTILNLMRQVWSSQGFSVAIIACIGALILIASAGRARRNAPVGRWAPPPPEIKPFEPVEPALLLARVPHTHNHSLFYSTHNTQSSEAIPLRAWMSSSTSLSEPLTPYGARAQSLSAPALERQDANTADPYTAPLEEAPAAPDSASAPEDLETPIALPIWRHVGSLIEEIHAATRTLAGEALGAAEMMESAPPIWRSVSALRIEVARVERPPEITGIVEWATSGEQAPRPPIWRAMAMEPGAETSGHTGPAIALLTERVRPFEEDSPDFSQIACAPPFWMGWPSSAWSAANATSASDDQTHPDALSIWSEPPIWAMPTHQADVM
jgi:hypothetical protein